MEALYNSLKGFSKKNWLDWTEDILCFNMASPFDRITAEGDVLMDVVDLLHNLKLPTRHYAEAIGDLLNELYLQHRHADRIVRLLNVLIVLKSSSQLPLLKRMLLDRNLDVVKWQDESLKAKVLQAMTDLTHNEDSLSDILAYLKNAGPRLFHRDLALMGSYLSFVLLHCEHAVFLGALSDSIIHVNNSISENMLPYAVSTLEDKLREYYFEHEHVFYRRFLDWLDLNAGLFMENSLFKAVVVKFAPSLNRRFNVYQKSSHHGKDVATLVVNVINLFADPTFIAKVDFETLEKMASFLYTENKIDLIDLIAIENSVYITDNFDSVDDNQDPRIENSDFSFRNSFLKIELFKNLIYLLNRAEQLQMKHTGRVRASGKYRAIQLRQLALEEE